ncbi:hypothetical protein [Lunatimonas lonarensis]|nr:hypothetical protein [Lunatimonas lonarensis]
MKTCPIIACLLLCSSVSLFGRQHPDNRPGFLIHPYLQYSTVHKRK